MTIALRCRAGKIPDNQICFLTSSEPENIQTSPNRNNKGVAITVLSGRKHPIFTDSLLLALLVLRAALPGSTHVPVIFITTPTLPQTKNAKQVLERGMRRICYCHLNIIEFSKRFPLKLRVVIKKMVLKLGGGNSTRC